MSRHKSMVVAAATVLLSLGACSSPAPMLSPTDAGAPDASPPAVTRALIDVPFMEGLPIDDRIGDALIELDANDWFFEDRMSGSPSVHVKKAALARAPVTQGALFVPKADNPNGVLFGALLKVPPGAYDASVWLGVPTGADPSSLYAGVVGFDQGGGPQPNVVDLTPSPDATKDLGGIHWVPYQVTVPASVAGGWAYLVFSTDGTTDAWLEAPIAHAPSASPHSFGKPHPLGAHLSRWLSHARSRHPTPPLPANRRRVTLRE